MGLDSGRVRLIFGLAVLANLLWLGHVLTGVNALYFVAYATGMAAVADLGLMMVKEERT